MTFNSTKFDVYNIDKGSIERKSVQKGLKCNFGIFSRFLKIEWHASHPTLLEVSSEPSNMISSKTCFRYYIYDICHTWHISTIHIHYPCDYPYDFIWPHIRHMTYPLSRRSKHASKDPFSPEQHNIIRLVAFNYDNGINGRPA